MDAEELELAIAKRDDAISALERIAYSRPVDDATRGAAELATVELARLRLEQEEDLERLSEITAIEVLSDLPTTQEEQSAAVAAPTLAKRQGPRVLLALSVVGALVLTAIVVNQFTGSSLDVFDRQQTPAEAEFGAAMEGLMSDPASTRLLLSDELWTVHAYRAAAGDVCVFAAFRGTGTSGCVPIEPFEEEGLTLDGWLPYYDQDDNAWKSVTLAWGPRDDLQVTATVVDSPEPDTAP